MTDLLLTDFVGLDQAVIRLAADIPNHEILQQPRLRLIGESEYARLVWAKRELAILKLHAALGDGTLVALVRDPVSGSLSRLTGLDWRSMTFWRETILGGAVCAVAGELARHDGGHVLLESVAFNTWLLEVAKTKQVRTADDADPEARCEEWLEAEMRAGAKPKPKPQMREDATTKFNVSGRAFDRIWAIVDERVHPDSRDSRWGRAGRRRKNQSNN
jgi:hypothetical protein